MDDAIRQAIADLSALIKDADSKDAERIREIIERLKSFDADTQHTLECIARLHKKFYH
jgi:Arc/MetJ-type ribon-helix-helix transcriptional regulator